MFVFLVYKDWDYNEWAWVCAAFSSREKAELYISDKILNGGRSDQYAIMEHELDRPEKTVWY